MSFSKTTLLSHIFNEEYLLPFWLNHHKDMFDEIIIVDYNSTDKSIEICKSICPECKIIKSRNKDFGAIDVDNEMMGIENGIKGIKIILNTTEFLFCEKQIKDLFACSAKPISYSVKSLSPYSLKNYVVNNNYELFNNLLNNDIRYSDFRGNRQMHNFPNGRYHTGRHQTNNPTTSTTDLHIIWLGYYPMNDDLMKRKLQIQTRIPQKDIDACFGFHHFFSKDHILSLNNEQVAVGKSLKELNPKLYNLLSAKYSDSDGK
jgi:hypothetical protein